jgi:hypothetical protein
MSAPQNMLQNRMMWRGQPGHYEVWYLTLTDRASKTGFWIRYTLEAPVTAHGEPYVQLWFCRGDGQSPENTFAINRRFPISALAHTQSPFEVRIGDATATHESMLGALSGHGHDVRWNLRWQAAPRVHHFLPKNLYGGSFAETLALSPNLHVDVHGTIEVDGRRYELKGEPAGQSHVWGRKHAYGWAWGHCTAFQNEDAGEGAPTEPTALETLSVLMRRGPVVLPLTLFAVYPDGLEGEPLRFTEWLTLPFCRSDYRTGHYALSGHNATTRVEAQFSCQPDDMVRAEYVDPDGAPAYCHFAGAATCRLSLFRRSFPGAKWELFRKLRSDRGAQFEWGGRAGDSLVKKRHMLIEST